MFMKEENWPELAALTSIFPVELPGIEPACLPGLLPSELPVRYGSVHFSTARYLRFRSQVSMASRVGVLSQTQNFALNCENTGTAHSHRPDATAGT
jgi:hypothetical protein